MILAMIVAIDQHNGIGKDNDQLAYISADLKRFKALTTGHTILMGRKTFEALPKGALPNRRNVVITRQAGYIAKGADVVTSLEQAIEICKGDEKVFVIGGGEIYATFLPQSDELFLTQIHHVFNEADVFFPKLEADEWVLSTEEGSFTDEKTQLSYSYRNLRRK